MGVSMGWNRQVEGAEGVVDSGKRDGAGRRNECVVDRWSLRREGAV
jgi:hypothetical protein